METWLLSHFSKVLKSVNTQEHKHIHPELCSFCWYSGEEVTPCRSRFPPLTYLCQIMYHSPFQSDSWCWVLVKIPVLWIIHDLPYYKPAVLHQISYQKKCVGDFLENDTAAPVSRRAGAKESERAKLFVAHVANEANEANKNMLVNINVYMLISYAVLHLNFPVPCRTIEP